MILNNAAPAIDLRAMLLATQLQNKPGFQGQPQSCGPSLAISAYRYSISAGVRPVRGRADLAGAAGGAGAQIKDLGIKQPE
jgi:hypothetical protein